MKKIIVTHSKNIVFVFSIISSLSFAPLLAACNLVDDYPDLSLDGLLLIER